MNSNRVRRDRRKTPKTPKIPDYLKIIAVVISGFVYVGELSNRLEHRLTALETDMAVVKRQVTPITHGDGS